MRIQQRAHLRRLCRHICRPARALVVAAATVSTAADAIPPPSSAPERLSLPPPPLLLLLAPNPEPTWRLKTQSKKQAGGRRGPPQLHENDYCPICHRALPLLPDPSEAGREAHISACLAPHVLAYSQPYSSGHNAPAAAGGRARSYTSGGRMVVWHAGAKDTCDPGTGDPIECVICFDEFVEGVEIARLECFCRYHKVVPVRGGFLATGAY